MKQVIMNKPNCLGLSILEVSKILMYLFWHDYVEPKYGEKRNYVTWIQTDSLIVYIKTEDITQALQKLLKQDLILQIMN